MLEKRESRIYNEYSGKGCDWAVLIFKLRCLTVCKLSIMIVSSHT